MDYRGTHVPQIGTIRASFVHRRHFGEMTVCKRKVGPYLVIASLDYMGRSSTTIWIKEDK